MQKKRINYEKLSKEIKEEIRLFHDQQKDLSTPLSIEVSMSEWFEKNFDEWLIKHITKDGSDTRRRHFRFEVEVPIKIVDTLIESSHDDAHAMELVGDVVNISRGGLYFKYHRPIELSSIIKVIVDLSKIDKDVDDVTALAMVIRQDKLSDGNFGIGLMFSTIYSIDKESIDLFLLKNLSNYIYSDQ